MISFPPAKINLGLQVLRRRLDGYHDLSTCMVEIPLTDMLEIVPSAFFRFTLSGAEIEGGENLCERSWKLMNERFGVPAVNMHLHKIIPMGAGLGGGSSDAVFVLKMLNDLYDCGLSFDALKELAAEIGSDCAFFVEGGAQLATGRGEVLEPISLNLPPWIVVINPGIHISTAAAYNSISPHDDIQSLEAILSSPVSEWKNILRNDFQSGVMERHPLIGELIDDLYDGGAVYAAMSGSGSTVFGLFGEKPVLSGIPDEYFTAVLPLS